jgi:hypothetical protein
MDPAHRFVDLDNKQVNPGNYLLPWRSRSDRVAKGTLKCRPRKWGWQLDIADSIHAEWRCSVSDGRYRERSEEMNEHQTKLPTPPVLGGERGRG